MRYLFLFPSILVLHAGFHTFDYARHFLSCCSRMLGLEHVTSRGSIMLEYYGRNVGVKIMPTGVKPERFLSGFAWQDTIWRRGELLSQARHKLAHCPTPAPTEGLAITWWSTAGAVWVPKWCLLAWMTWSISRGGGSMGQVDCRT